MLLKDGLDVLEAAIKPLDTAERRERYRKGDFPNADKVKDLDKRYRWDLLWASGDRYFLDFARALDATDNHIDTALRRVVKPL